MTATLPRYTVTDLGSLPGFESSLATGLNDREQVIGYLRHEDLDFTPNGFVWSEGKMRDLGKVRLTSINNKGQGVGARHPEFMTYSAIIYTAGRFKELLKNTSAISMAECINDCGQVVGHLQSTNWKTPADTKRGCYIWENGKRRYLDIPEGYEAGFATGINNQGVIVGQVWHGHPNDEHAVVWKQDSTRLLGEPNGFSESKAVAVNNQGHILVKAIQSNVYDLLKEAFQGINFTLHDDVEVIHKGFKDLAQATSTLPKDAFVINRQAFLWKEGNWQSLEGLELALAMNDLDQVVGWSGCGIDKKTCKKSCALLWQNGELIDLNELISPKSGWRLTRANDINNHGQIVGYGEHDGKTRAFLLTPITQ